MMIMFNGLQTKALLIGFMLFSANVQVSMAARGCVSDCVDDRGGLGNYVRYQINDDESECPWKLCAFTGQSYEDFTHPDHDAIDKYGQTAASLNMEWLTETLYVLRHGGASKDVNAKRRPLQEIQRWGH